MTIVSKQITASYEVRSLLFSCLPDFGYGKDLSVDRARETQPTMPIEFYLLREQKVAYLVMKKCGCTSLMAGMKKLQQHDFAPEDTGAIHRDRESIVLASELTAEDDWYAFTLVRDPIRRFLSFYSDKIRVSGIKKNNNVTGNPGVTGYYNNMNLDEAIDVTVGGKFEPDPHVVVQSSVIAGAGFPLNYVGKVEAFADSIAQVASDTGTTIPSLHLNSHTRLPIKLSRVQFEKLALFYAIDIERFGYPESYDEWLKANVAEDESNFGESQGYVFTNEATLLNYRIELDSKKCIIRLKWQVAPDHSRYRVARIVVAGDDQRDVVKSFKRVDSLMPIADHNGIAEERLEFQLDELPKDKPIDDLFFVVYFWKEGAAKKAIMEDSHDANLLSFPLKQS